MQTSTTKKTIHLVSFDVPYPPNYGGVIDVYYKLKNLHTLGVSVILHTYEYGRGRQKDLEKYCEKVCYYKRNNSIKNVFSRKPFIVKSRNNPTLVENLKADKHPILFEGLHTTYPLIANAFTDRKVIVRTHNIEHEYYKGLRKSETSKRKKVFFEAEAAKLKTYEAILNKVDYILTISPFEHNYFSNKYGNKAVYVPVFFENSKCDFIEPENKTTLWHGDLRVADNLKAALFVVSVFAELDQPLKIASSYRKKELIEKCNAHKNIEFIDLSKNDNLDELFRSCHIHTLLTFQKTGIKLKLLNVLQKGKHIIANTPMIEDTGLESCCKTANTKQEFITAIAKLVDTPFDLKEKEKRMRLLEDFNPKQSAQKIIELLN